VLPNTSKWIGAKNGLYFLGTDMSTKL